MSSAREMLALRKEVLVARSALQRLQVARDVGALREGLRWPLAGAALLASPPARAGLLALLLLLGRRGPRLLRRAAAVAGLAAVVVRLLKRASVAESLPEGGAHPRTPPL